MTVLHVYRLASSGSAAQQMNHCVQAANALTLEKVCAHNSIEMRQRHDRLRPERLWLPKASAVDFVTSACARPVCNSALHFRLEQFERWPYGIVPGVLIGQELVADWAQ